MTNTYTLNLSLTHTHAQFYTAVCTHSNHNKHTYAHTHTHTHIFYHSWSLPSKNTHTHAHAYSFCLSRGKCGIEALVNVHTEKNVENVLRPHNWNCSYCRWYYFTFFKAFTFGSRPQRWLIIVLVSALLLKFFCNGRLWQGFSTFRSWRQFTVLLKHVTERPKIRFHEPFYLPVENHWHKRPSLLLKNISFDKNLLTSNFFQKFVKSSFSS